MKHYNVSQRYLGSRFRMYVVDNSNACGLTVCKHKFWVFFPDLACIDFFWHTVVVVPVTKLQVMAALVPP